MKHDEHGEFIRSNGWMDLWQETTSNRQQTMKDKGLIEHVQMYLSLAPFLPSRSFHLVAPLWKDDNDFVVIEVNEGKSISAGM